MTKAAARQSYKQAESKLIANVLSSIQATHEIDEAIKFAAMCNEWCLFRHRVALYMYHLLGVRNVVIVTLCSSMTLTASS